MEEIKLLEKSLCAMQPRVPGRLHARSETMGPGWRAPPLQPGSVTPGHILSARIRWNRHVSVTRGSHRRGRQGGGCAGGEEGHLACCPHTERGSGSLSTHRGRILPSPSQQGRIQLRTQRLWVRKASQLLPLWAKTWGSQER